MSNQNISKIIINSFENPYTSEPNPVSFFTYPVSGVPVKVTYNGSSGIPTKRGNYDLYIGPIDSGYNIQPVTGIYSIVGDIAFKSYALGWGNDTSRNIQLPTAPTGLEGVQKLVGGNDFSVALMSDNSIVTWGTGNQYGQQNIPYISNYVKDIFASNNTTFITDWDGNLTGCGYLFNTLENGYSGYIPLLTDISGVSAADYYAIAIPSNHRTSLKAWGDTGKMSFNYTPGLATTFTGIFDVSATNLGYVCFFHGRLAIAIGDTVSGGKYGQFAWSGKDNTNIKKIVCSDYCTAFLYNNNTMTGFGKLVGANGEMYPFSIPDQSLQGRILDIDIASGHVLLVTSGYIPPQPPLPPPCSGIIYV